MHFIRENLFLVCVVAAVVVVGGIMILYEFNLDDRIASRKDQRDAVTKDIKTLAALPRPINASIVEGQTLKVQSIREAAKQVGDENARWNRVRYKVMTRTVTEKGKPIVVPLFPINEEIFRPHALRYQFQLEYQKLMDDLLATLGPTAPPTDQEIAQAARDWDTQLKQNRERKRMIESRETRDAAAGGPMPSLGERGMAPPMGSVPVAPGGPAAGPGGRRVGGGAGAVVPPSSGDRLPAASDIDPEALDVFGEDFDFRRITLAVPTSIRGLTNSRLANYLGYMAARKKNAGNGNIYASRECLDAIFPWGMTPSASPPDTYLWSAQVNLWVTQDILESIAKTNKAAIQSLPKTVPPSVLNLPIKRLAQVDIAEQSGAPLAAPGAAGTPRTPAPMPMMLPGMMMEGSGQRPGAPAGPVVADSLTQRVPTKDYDLIRYQFTVVMAMEYLKLLEVNLLSLNYHTITEIAVTEVQPADTHYYGIQPVMEVKIKGELVLLTNWLRGTRDKEKKGWAADKPPLMPVEVMEVLPATALREEDQARISESRKAALGGMPRP